MKAKKPKKVTNVYWSNINTDWRLSSDPIKENSQYDRLLNLEQPSLAHSFPTSISDWEKFNMNYRSCLQSLEICELASSELLNIIKGEGDQEKMIQRNIEPSDRDNLIKYLAMTQEANGVSDEKRSMRTAQAGLINTQALRSKANIMFRNLCLAIKLIKYWADMQTKQAKA